MSGIPSNPNVAVLSGKGSWFGGPHDSMAGGAPAGGRGYSGGIIAVYNQATLNGYWRVQAPNGRTAVIRQGDLGPHPSTGRSVDISYNALGMFGYNESNFPTDGHFTATYLGKNPHAAGAAGASAAAQNGSSTPAAPATDPNSDPQVQALLGSLLSTHNIVGKGAKLGGGDLLSAAAGTPPAPAPQASAPNVMGSAPSGGGGHYANGHLGGFLPAGAKLTYGRIDAGQDGSTTPGGPLIAPGSGHVVAVKSDPGGFGPSYPVVHFDTGPLAGKDVYLGHTYSALQAGARFSQGQVLAHTGTHGVGNATVPGWFEIGLASALGQGNRGQGNQIKGYLR